MILTKLQEALGEVDSQRAPLKAQLVALDEVEAQLRAMIAKLSGVAIQPVRSTAALNALHDARDRDKLDEVADILRAEGKPLHITVIAERLSALRGHAVARTTIEPGLNRHVSKVKQLRVAKFAPSTFGLPEWKNASVAGLLYDVATDTATVVGKAS